MDSPAELWILSPFSEGQLFGRLGRISAKLGVNLVPRKRKKVDGTLGEVTSYTAEVGNASGLEKRSRGEADLNRVPL